MKIEVNRLSDRFIDRQIHLTREQLSINAYPKEYSQPYLVNEFNSLPLRQLYFHSAYQSETVGQGSHSTLYQYLSNIVIGSARLLTIAQRTPFEVHRCFSSKGENPEINPYLRGCRNLVPERRSSHAEPSQLSLQACGNADLVASLSKYQNRHLLVEGPVSQRQETPLIYMTNSEKGKVGNPKN